MPQTPQEFPVGVRYVCYYDCNRWNCSVEILLVSMTYSVSVQVYDHNGTFIWEDRFQPITPYTTKHIDLNSVAAGTEGTVVVFPSTRGGNMNWGYPAQLVIRGSGSNQDTVVNFMEIPEGINA